MRSIRLAALLAALASPALATPASAELAATDRARIEAMDGAALMTAVAEADLGLATDLARLSNVAAIAEVCKFPDADLGGAPAEVLNGRLGAVADEAQRLTAGRYFDDIFAKDVESWRREPRAELCTDGNRDHVAGVLAELR